MLVKPQSRFDFDTPEDMRKENRFESLWINTNRMKIKEKRADTNRKTSLRSSSLPVLLIPQVFQEGLYQFLMQHQKSGFTPALLVFLVLSQQIGWQGYGQVNRTVVDTIMDYINTNVSQHTAASSYDTFNTAFSTELNRRWDPAWNVFTIKTTSADDTVLYGYAFRDQINGVVLAFVIWKDYNCQGWQNVGKNGLDSGLAPNSQIISSILFTNVAKDDLWNGARVNVDRFLSINSQVVSIIASQDTTSDIYGRACVLEGKVYYSKAAAVPPFQYQNVVWGNILVFQTR